jgi:SSS family solute:Na+ symporter
MNFLGTIDWIVVGLYFLVIAALSLYSMRKKKDSASEYFLANRNVGWFIVGASILASNIGSEHVVGLAGTAAKSGLAMGHYELHSWIILMLGWVFVPFYMRSAVYTMPEFLERRYNAKTRWLLSIIQLLSYIIAKVSVTVYAGAIVITSFLGIDFWTGAIVLIVITGIYTVLGGLRAVMYTETLQAVILLLGAIVLTITGLHAVGGWQGLVAATPSSHLNMFLPLNDPNFPWLGILFASPIVGIWYWCTDQHIVQRCLAARDETQARRGTIFAAYLKLFPVFIFMIPGIIAYVLAKSGKISLPVTDQAFPTLVKALLPVGFRGLVAGGLLAALMSSLAAVYNACSTLFTMDIYIKIKPNATQKELVKVGRIATGVVVILGVIWIPIMAGISGTLYQYLQSVQSYLAPPIAAVFLLGVFSKRINGKGAWAAMVGGFIIGCLRIVLELLRNDLSGILYTFATINFLYFCILLFVLSIIILVTVSLLTEKPSFEQLNGLTFATTVAEDKAKSRASWNTRDLVLSLIVVVIIIAAFLYFSPFGVAH